MFVKMIQAYIASHPELAVALELIFENVCQKCDEFEKSENENRNSETDASESKSPVQLTLDFLSTENLEDLVERRMKENKK
jgi:hypothetical protein